MVVILPLSQEGVSKVYPRYKQLRVTLYQSLEGNKEYGARMEQMYFILYVNVRTYLLSIIKTRCLSSAWKYIRIHRKTDVLISKKKTDVLLDIFHTYAYVVDPAPPN